MPHCISLPVGERLLRLSEHFELVWASGWEDKANFYLPQILGLPEMPHVSFDVAARIGGAHWKLGPLEEYAAAGRSPGSTTTSTRAVTSGRGARPEPTLLVPTEPQLGLEEGHAEALNAWADLDLYTTPVTGFWPIFFLLVVLKIPVLGSIWLVWWAARQTPNRRSASEDGRRLQAPAAAEAAPRPAPRPPRGRRRPAGAGLPAGRPHPGRQARCAARFRSRRISRR